MEALSATSRRVHQCLRELPSERRSQATNADLADLLGVSPFTVSRSISEMVRKGWVVVEWQSPHPGKRRFSGRTIRLVDPS